MQGSLKDNDGNYLWRPGIELGQPSSLAGYGIVENEQMPDIAADAKATAFGHFKRGYTSRLIVSAPASCAILTPTNRLWAFIQPNEPAVCWWILRAIKLMKIGAANHQKAAA